MLTKGTTYSNREWVSISVPKFELYKYGTNMRGIDEDVLTKLA